MALIADKSLTIADKVHLIADKNFLPEKSYRNY